MLGSKVCLGPEPNVNEEEAQLWFCSAWLGYCFYDSGSNFHKSGAMFCSMAFSSKK